MAKHRENHETPPAEVPVEVPVEQTGPIPVETPVIVPTVRTLEGRKGEKFVIELAHGETLELTIKKTSGTFATLELHPHAAIKKVKKELEC